MPKPASIRPVPGQCLPCQRCPVCATQFAAMYPGAPANGPRAAGDLSCARVCSANSSPAWLRDRAIDRSDSRDQRPRRQPYGFDVDRIVANAEAPRSPADSNFGKRCGS